MRELPCKLDFSSWAGCCRTPKSTKIPRKNRRQFLGRMLQRQKRQKSTSFSKNPVQEHCRTPKSTRITTKNEHRRSWRAEKVRKFTDKTRARPGGHPENYENSQTKRTCKHETTKIAMNSAQSPVRHLDLATPPFYPYRKNPKCYHTVWGKTLQNFSKRMVLWWHTNSEPTTSQLPLSHEISASPPHVHCHPKRPHSIETFFRFKFPKTPDLSSIL